MSIAMIKDLEAILEEVIEIIIKAGAETLSLYTQDYEVKYKGPNNPVTQADIESNRLITTGLKKFNYGILSEETVDDGSRLQKRRAWIVDPLDGTSDFIDKTGDFTIVIGLVEQGRPILGVVYQPVTDTLYYGIKGSGSFSRIGDENPVVLHVSAETNLRKFTMLSSRFHRSELEISFANNFGIKNFVTRGSLLKICQIAAGQGELNFNPSSKTWEYDICAADIILTEAGGRLTDMDGRIFTYNKSNPRNERGYVASNGAVHEAIIEHLSIS
jgi:3'(2'), 5'-bisphosphate nucleotidase